MTTATTAWPYWTEAGAPKLSCVRCDRKFAIRNDGTIRRHRADARDEVEHWWCPGSEKEPYEDPLTLEWAT
jgi:hypothetical protein